MENHYRSTAGVDVPALIGAVRFYAAGYSGAGATMANVEAGHIWNGHESLGHVTTFVQTSHAPGTQTGEFDRHATWVGHAMGGRAPVGAADPAIPRGVAPDAELWSGSIATAWTGNRGNPDYSLGFQISNDTYSVPYRQIMVDGVPGAGGRTADVVNSSWGAGGLRDGFDAISVSIDAMINDSGVVFTASAGNSAGANTIDAPASGFNAITVAALQPTAENDFDAVAGFSSRAPQDVRIPGGPLIQGARARIDIAAPGQSLSLAFYEGATGGNRDDPTPVAGDPTAYSANVSGTSFAAPTVAGGAALVIDAGRGELSGEAKTRVEDGRVVKAVLLNSADKIPLWNNGQVAVDSVITTVQSLDFASGAGRMNLDAAYDQLLAGTTDVPGLGGGEVEPIGWDFGQVAQNAPVDYFIATPLAGGSWFTATLAWFVDAAFSYLNQQFMAAPVSFDDLDLEIWSATSAGAFVSKVAESISQYNTVEHLHFMLPTDGFYGIRVIWFGENWDFADDLNQEFFGLAWSGSAVPAPGMLALFALAALLTLRRAAARPGGARG